MCSPTRRGGWAGSTSASKAREGAYVRYDELGERRRAGQCAVWLYEHYCFKARPAIAGGWLRRARHALEDDQESAEYGALRLREAETAHGRGDLDASAAAAREVVDLARRLRSPDLEAEALQTLGRVLIDDGDPTEGLATLDEAMLFAVEGRLRPYSTGKVYCSLISACEALGDLRRAAEWSEATTRWAQRHPLAVFPGLCRVHLASSLRSRGEWNEAEDQAVRACAELATLNVTNAAAGLRRDRRDPAPDRRPRRRRGRVPHAPSSSAASRSPGSRSCGWRRETSTPRSRSSPARSTRSPGTAWVGPGCFPPAPRSRSPPAISRARPRCVEELESIASDFASPALTAAALSTRGRVQLASDDRSACATLRQAAERLAGARRSARGGDGPDAAGRRVSAGRRPRRRGRLVRGRRRALRAARRGPRPPQPPRHRDSAARRTCPPGSPRARSRCCDSWPPA